jgi:chemotaxis protein MotB
MGSRTPRRRKDDSGEFLWLMSLSDLMILLFILFVVLFSASYKKMKQSDFNAIAASMRNEPAPPNPIDKVAENLRKWVSEQKLNDKVSVQKVDDTVLLQIKDKVLFASGGFEILPGGVHTVRSLEKTLESVPDSYQIGIEGHTDDTPIHSRQIRDNWDLSSKRAMAVMQSLTLSEKLLKRTVIMAYGDTRPIAPNRTPAGKPIEENQSKNRRVTLRIF